MSSELIWNGRLRTNRILEGKEAEQESWSISCNVCVCVCVWRKSTACSTLHVALGCLGMQSTCSNRCHVHRM